MIADKLITVASVGSVAAVIASLSDEAAQFAADLSGGASQMDFAMVRTATARVPEIVTATVGYYGADHAMLVFLAFGALVFLGLMFRT